MKNIIVTGGAGFLGSFLCEALLRDGNNVIAIDDLSTGHVRNIEALLPNPRFQFLKFSLNDGIDLNELTELDLFKVKFEGVQEIYHLGTPTAVKNFENLRLAALHTASVGAKNVMEWAVKYQSKVVLASSATVYGARQGTDLIKETDLGTVDQLSPRACFNEGKRFEETVVSTYAAVYGIDVKIARLFRTYGPRMPIFHGHQIPDFALSIIDNQPITILGDANTKTSLVFVSDIVDGLIRLMRAPAGTGAVNFGSESELPIVDIAKLMMKILGHEVPINYEAISPHLIPLGLPSLNKAREVLGWIPLVRLEDGLRKTCDYVQANKLLLTGEER